MYFLGRYIVLQHFRIYLQDTRKGYAVLKRLKQQYNFIIFPNITTNTMLYSLMFYLTNIPRLHLWAFATLTYIIYYLLQVVKRPTVACADGPFIKFLYNNIPTLQMKYWPTFWCVESRAQTLFASIIRSIVLPKIKYRREIFVLPDGGEVALDWMEDGCNNDSPCVILLPGLTGESQAEYVKCLVIAAQQSGLRVVVFNNRGLGGIELKTPRLYCASNCEDLSEVVKHVGKMVPKEKLGAVGISMGGQILGNYLVQKSLEARTYLAAANIISAPWNVQKGAVSIEKPILNNLMGRHLASNLCKNLTNSDIFKDADIDMKKILKCKTIKEFDTFFTSKHFGYADVDDYYSDATLHNKLHYITVPLLCLSAADDPFQPLEAIPIKPAEESTHVAIVVTARGGHIGFLQGLWPSSREEYMGRLFVEYFTTVLSDKMDEFQKITKEMLEKCDEHKYSFSSEDPEKPAIINISSFLKTEQLIN